MAEDGWQNLPYNKPHASVFENGWPDKDAFPSHEEAYWDKVRESTCF